MRHHRFYQQNLEFENGRTTVSDARLVQQWRRVLRYSVSDELILFGSGQEYVCEITSIDKRSVRLHQKSISSSILPKSKLTLAWSLLKRSNNELILQKATELGVSELQPIEAHRSEKHTVTHTQSERWQKIIIEASEQCGRGDIPILREPITSTQFIKEQHSISIVAEKDSALPESHRQADGDRNVVLVGPEGGWSEDELALFRLYQVPRIDLGDFTLRAETAAIISVGFLLDRR